MGIHAEFSRRSLQAIARLAAYVFLLEYLFNAVLGALPVSAQPERLLGQIGSLLDTASLPVLAVILLYGGLLSGVRPARWEWRLARLLRPLLAITAVLCLVLIPVVWGLGSAIQSRGDAGLRQQAGQAQQQLSAYRATLAAAADAGQLRRLLDAQPQLQPVLNSPDSPFANPNAGFPEQRQQAVQLVDRVMANVRAESLQRRADAAGELRKQQLRLSGMAAIHVLFFLLAFLVWPNGLSSLAPGMQAIDAIESDAEA